MKDKWFPRWFLGALLAPGWHYDDETGQMHWGRIATYILRVVFPMWIRSRPERISATWRRTIGHPINAFLVGHRFRQPFKPDPRILEAQQRVQTEWLHLLRLCGCLNRCHVEHFFRASDLTDVYLHNNGRFEVSRESKTRAQSEVAFIAWAQEQEHGVLRRGGMTK